MEIVFATNNGHKLEEARMLAGDGINILSLADIGCHEPLPEDFDTIEQNSLQKARYVSERYGCDCFADDTGLFVDALGGAPGVYSARYAGPECEPEHNIEKLMREMQGKTDRKARFRTVVTLVRAGADEVCRFEGVAEGRIALERHGRGGFGYDPVFISDENGISFAELSPEDKNSISHRGKALRTLFEFIRK